MINFDVPTYLSIITIISFLVYKNYSAYKKSTGENKTSLRFLLALIICVNIVPILLFTIIIFWCYRQLINAILIVQHGKHYGGLLEGIDATHTTKTATNVPVHFLFVIQHKRDEIGFSQFFRQAINKKIETLKRIPKVFASLESFSGYSYLLRNEVSFEDCFRKLKRLPRKEITKSDLMALMGEYSDVPLPKKGLWDIFVGEQPIQWTKDGSEFYPVVFRFHHSLADGVSLLHAILNIFTDSNSVKLCSNTANSNKIGEDKSTIFLKYINQTKYFCFRVVSAIKFYINIILVMSLTPSAILVQLWFKRNDKNILYGPKLTNKKIMSIKVEESPQYIEMVKRIKNKLNGCTFTDVFLTAISASLSEYYTKKNTEIPSYITAAVPASPAANPRGGNKIAQQEKTQFCRNNASIYVPKLPIKMNCQNSETNMIDRLKIIQKQGNLFKNSMDYEINYWILRIFGAVFPKQIGELLGELNGCTMGVSNLPGTPFVSFLNEALVQDIAFWLANRERTGVAFSILTYGGRLQMGLLVDKILISEQDEVDSILEGVYKHIHLLDCHIRRVDTLIA